MLQANHVLLPSNMRSIFGVRGGNQATEFDLLARPSGQKEYASRAMSFPMGPICGWIL
jgi:hypothetical protein